MTALDVAYGRLLAALEDHEYAGRVIPCRGPSRDAWVEEDRKRQEFAADQCHACPVLEQCGAYAITYAEPTGTWGGLTPARRSELRRQTRMAAA